jgi:hypothetical protein
LKIYVFTIIENSGPKAAGLRIFGEFSLVAVAASYPTYQDPAELSGVPPGKDVAID